MAKLPIPIPNPPAFLVYFLVIALVYNRVVLDRGRDDPDVGDYLLVIVITFVARRMMK